MTNIHRELDHAQDSAHDNLDRALDAALAQYTAVEPRPGLEGRILANLRTAPADALPSVWWRWTWATVAAVVIVAALFVWNLAKPSHRKLANHPEAVETQASTKQVSAKQVSAKPAPQAAVSQISSTRNPQRNSAMRSGMTPHLAAATADPKLDVFPSPQPLSEEELALARYVRNFPTDAKIAARAQAAEEKEVLARMQALANESEESN